MLPKKKNLHRFQLTVRAIQLMSGEFNTNWPPSKMQNNIL